MTERERLLAQSGLFDPDWYAARYGEAARGGADPLAHFLAVGWDLGRDPGPGFDARGYLARYADVAESGMDALSHYLRYGAAEGRAATPGSDDPLLLARARSDVWRARLNVLGQRSALHALERLAKGADGDEAGFAGRDLALWHLRQWRQTGAAEAARAAADHALAAEQVARDPVLCSRLLTLRLVAQAAAGKAPPTPAQLAQWAQAGLVTGDTWLAVTGFAASPEERLEHINRALAAHGLAPLALHERAGDTAYDRLQPAADPVSVEGPLVSVLIAAYKSEATLPATLRAIAAQSWRNLEILVVDDASPDGTAAVAEAAARSDPRIKVIRQPQNGGAYAARNAALAAARGTYVTLQDADDWCHPDRIARQVAHLSDAPGAVACTCEYLRLQPDLRVTRLSPEAHFVTENPASVLFRREPVVAALGGWDEVRVGADNEFLRRLDRVFGDKAVNSAATGPLGLLRDWEGSAVRGGPLSIDGYVTGARLAYLDAQTHFHASAPVEALHYRPGARPFPAPRVMHRPEAGPVQLSLILAADLRRPGRMVETCLTLVGLAGGPVGLVPLARPVAPDGSDAPLRLCAAMRAALAEDRLVQLCHGESASAPVMVLPDPEALQELPDPLPALSARAVRILADHPPVSLLPGTGRRLTRYDPAQCEEAARRLSRGDPEWWPVSAAIRKALAEAGITRFARRAIGARDPGRILR